MAAEKPPGNNDNGGFPVNVRNYRPGDEDGQAAVFNAAAGSLPKFKPATSFEIRRRCQDRDFDPTTWFYAEEGSQIVAYATFHKSGRVSYPWCLPGHEGLAEPLFERVLEAMKARKHASAFTAYRADWTPVNDFMLGHGFRKERDMLNFVVDLIDMPTPPARPSNTITPLKREDVPAMLAMNPKTLRVTTREELERHFFENPYFTPGSLYAIRDKSAHEPLAVGVFIENDKYADPNVVDAGMPCFRLGAFGTEGLGSKRLNGMFSFLTRADQQINPLGLDLIGHAAYRLQKSDDLGTFAGQIASDAPAPLVRFYQSHFRRQGSFPVFVKDLA
jgi:hypothetical protein